MIFIDWFWLSDRGRTDADYKSVEILRNPENVKKISSLQ